MSVIENPPPTLSKLTVAIVSMLCALIPASSNCFESAIEKQPACAAAINSSGFVPVPFSNLVLNEYCVFDRTPLAVETVPSPSSSPPSQCALPLRLIIAVLSPTGLCAAHQHTRCAHYDITASTHRASQ